MPPARLDRAGEQADPKVVEELKWKKPSAPGGVPVWSDDGPICTGETYNLRGPTPDARMIRLIGPGGAGKTTAGTALAERLNVPFLDLDAEFSNRIGDITAYLDAHGYDAYARCNVSLYLELAGAMERAGVVAISSGFMTYRGDVYPRYADCRQRIASDCLTFVLLPSFDIETCVAEIVRRQLQRRFARTAQREEQVIRARFPLYFSLPARKVNTLRPIEATVGELVATVTAEEAAAAG